jgi:hypothetical protein
MAVLGRLAYENLQEFREEIGVQVPLLALRLASSLGSLPWIVPFATRARDNLVPFLAGKQGRRERSGSR